MSGFWGKFTTTDYVDTLMESAATCTTAELHVYADGTSGSDANDGLSVSTPKKTLQAVFDLVPDLVKHNTCVHLTGNFTTGGYHYLNRPLSRSAVLLVDGGPDASVAADDGGSPWAADIASTTSIGLTTAGWTIDQYAGYWVEILSGPALGQTRMIQGNNATTITPVRNFSTSPIAGATFRIIRPTTEISDGLIVLGNGARDLARLEIQRLYLTGTVAGISSWWSSGDVHLQAIISNRSGGTGAAFGQTYGVMRFGNSVRDPTTFASASAVGDPALGCSDVGSIAFSFSSVGSQTNLQMLSVYFKNLAKVDRSAPMGPAFGYGARFAGGLDISSANGGIQYVFLATTAGWATSKIGGTGLRIWGSQIRIGPGVDISNSSTHGITCDNSRLHLDGAVVGTGNAGFGVAAKNNSTVLIKTGASPTLTGSSGEITLDGTTDATWAGIAAAPIVETTVDLVVAKAVA